MWLGDVNDVMHRKRARRILGGFEKSQLVEFCLGRRRLTLGARRSQAGGFTAGVARVVVGADGKFSIERWYLSPYVEKPLNSNVINSFVPELRSRKCFSCFGIPILSIYERYEHYERFTYRYVDFTYSHLIIYHTSQQRTNMAQGRF